MSLCPHCSGRGFAWNKQVVVRKDGEHIADLRRQGPVCSACHGTGTYNGFWRHFAGGLITAGILATLFVMLAM